MLTNITPKSFPCAWAGVKTRPFFGENHVLLGLPHEIKGKCTKVNNLPCDPGMKGCELAGRYVFTSNDEKNKRFREKLARDAAVNKKSD
jgi:hypothetical protein